MLMLLQVPLRSLKIRALKQRLKHRTAVIFIALSSNTLMING